MSFSGKMFSDVRITNEDIIRSLLSGGGKGGKFYIHSRCNASFRVPDHYEQIEACYKISAELTEKVAKELGLWDDYVKFKEEQKRMVEQQKRIEAEKIKGIE